MENSNSTKNKKVAVVGAGIAGLTAAYELQKAGFEVRVFESEATAGGRIKTDIHDGLAFDKGTNWFVENYSSIKKYAGEFGIPWFSSKPEGVQRVVRGGEPKSLNISSATDVMRFDVLSPWARVKFFFWLIKLWFGRSGTDFYELSKLPESMDFDNADHYLRTRVHPEVADYVADPFTAAMQFHRCKEISTSALFAIMKPMIMPNGGFEVRYTKGGVGSVPMEMAKSLNIKYSLPVTKVFSRDGSVEITAGSEVEKFDAVVIAAPARAVSEMLSAKTPALNKVLQTVQYTSTIVLCAKVPEEWFTDNAHVTYIPFIESDIIASYSNESRKGDLCCAGGMTHMLIYLYDGAAKNLMEKSDGEVWNEVLKELPRVCREYRGHEEELEQVTLWRWKEAMPKFDHGYLSLVKKFEETEQGQNNLFFAGDYLNAPWAEGACRSGQRAASLIVERFML